MFKLNRPTTLLAILVVLVVIIGIAWLTIFDVNQAQAQDAHEYEWHRCTPDQVSVILNEGANNRVHVHCSNSFMIRGNTYEYFALPVDHAGAATVVDMGMHALDENVPLLIYFDYGAEAEDGGDFGCFPLNCRPILQLSYEQ